MLPYSALLEPEQLAAIRDLGIAGMQTEVQIFRSGITPEDPAGGGYSASNDYGDDEVGDPAAVPEPEAGTGSLVATTFGWFYSSLQQDISDGGGQLVTVDIHVLRIPVGIDVRPEDFVVRVDNGNRYTVVDTNNDDTWPEWQKVMLRRRE